MDSDEDSVGSTRLPGEVTENEGRSYMGLKVEQDGRIDTRENKGQMENNLKDQMTSFVSDSNSFTVPSTPNTHVAVSAKELSKTVVSSINAFDTARNESLMLKEVRLEQFDFDEADLHELAKDGDHTMLETVLGRMSIDKAVRRVNKKDGDRYTPLHYAVRYCHIDSCHTLKKFKADVHARGDDGVTALHIAAKFKPRKEKVDDENDGNDNSGDEDDLRLQDFNRKCVDFLLTNGSRVNDKDFYGLTALHHAAMRGNYDCAKMLLQHPDTNIEATDKQLMTPLHVSSVYGNVNIFELLVNYNANIRCRDEDNGTPLQFAAAEGNLQIVKLILKTIKEKNGEKALIEMLRETDNDGSTALHLCIGNGHLEVTKEIINCALSHGNAAALNVKRNNKETPLHIASSNGYLEIVQHLVSNGAKVNVKDENFATPLLLASQRNHFQIVEYLIGVGAKLESHDVDNFTPLLLAANYGHTETISVLLRHKADVTSCDKYDKSVLFQCAEENRADALQIFLKNKKAKKLVENTDRYDNTPLHIAASEGHLQIVKILLEANVAIDPKNEDEQTPLHLAADQGHIHIINLLVKKKKDIMQDDDENGDTPLHLAALKGRTNCVKELVKLGASITARNSKQWTPLDCCAYAGMKNSAVVLLEADAPVDPKDKRKVTPLHLACQQGHEELVNLLIKWKADVSNRSQSGKNALDFAIDSNHADCARAIINSEFWREALKNRSKDYGIEEQISTPMRKLIKKMPGVAEDVFVKCISTNGKNPEDIRYEVTFDYEFLDDEYSNVYWKGIEDFTSEFSFNITEASDKSFKETDRCSTSSIITNDSIYDDDGRLVHGVTTYAKEASLLQDNHPLMIMVKSKRTSLLRNPLVVSLLNLKWKLYGRYFYYISLIHLILTLVLINSYMLTVPPPFGVNETATSASGCIIVVDVLQDVWGSSCPRMYQNWQNPAQVLIFIFAGFGLIKELYQLFSTGVYYFKSLTNTIELPLYTFCILVVIDFNTVTYQRMNWQWQVGAIAILFSWAALILNIQNLPRFGLYVVMFSDVLRSFLSFLLVFFLFIFGFGFTFHVLLQNQYAFSRWWGSLIKTFIMMIGEFEYSDMFITEYTDNTFVAKVNYNAVTNIMFVVFVIVMSIVIMNLLIGLAVDDIKEVQDNAELTSLAMQVKLTLDVEYTLPEWLRRKLMRKYRKYRPNRYKKAAPVIRWFKKENYLDHNSLSEALRSEKSDLENVESKVEAVQNKLKDVKITLNKFRVETKNLALITKAIAKHLEVDIADHQENNDQ